MRCSNKQEIHDVRHPSTFGEEVQTTHSEPYITNIAFDCILPGKNSNNNDAHCNASCNLRTNAKVLATIAALECQTSSHTDSFSLEFVFQTNSNRQGFGGE